MAFDGTFARSNEDSKGCNQETTRKAKNATLSSLSEELLQYLLQIEAELDAVQQETNETTLNHVASSSRVATSVHEELTNAPPDSLAELVQHYEGSRILEKLVQQSDVAQLGQLLSQLRPHLSELARSATASHVLQTSIKRLRPLIDAQQRQSSCPIDEQHDGAVVLLQLLHATMKAYKGATLLTDTYASHITRSLMISLNGRTPLRRTDHKQRRLAVSFRVPSQFTCHLIDFLDHLTAEAVPNPSALRALALHAVASPTLQLVLQLVADLMEPPSRASAASSLDAPTQAILQRLSGRLFEGFVEAAGNVAQQRAMLVHLAKHRNGSRFLELFLESFPRDSTAFVPLLRSLWQQLIQLEWKALLNDPNGNFCLQAFLEALKAAPLELAEDVLHQLLLKLVAADRPWLQALPVKNRLGILPKLSALLSSSLLAGLFIDLVCRIFGLEDKDADRQLLFMPVLLACCPAKDLRLGRSSDFQLFGTLAFDNILRVVFQAKDVQLQHFVLHSFILNFQVDELLRMARHPMASHVVEAFLLHVVPVSDVAMGLAKSFLSFILKDQASLLLDLAVHRYASRVIESLGSVLPSVLSLQLLHRLKAINDDHHELGLSNDAAKILSLVIQKLQLSLAVSSTPPSLPDLSIPQGSSISQASSVLESLPNSNEPSSKGKAKKRKHDSSDKPSKKLKRKK